MRDLFEAYPTLRGARVILRKMVPADAPALQTFTASEAVYQYLPTFLYEQKYEDAVEVIAKMDAECFETRESILLAVCLQNAPAQLVGIAEIYHFEAHKEKASIGCRLSEAVWGQGIATEVIGLLRDYLIDEIGLRTITAHIMRVNLPSAKAAQKNGFLCKYPGIYGDWGMPELILTDKYVFKRDWTNASAADADAEGSDTGVSGTGDADAKGRNQSVLPTVQVEQFVLAYRIEQDRIRSMLPEGFESLRPVLRINAEIRNDDVVYVEFNTPVAADGRRGWLNIANWKSSTGADLHFARAGRAVPAETAAEPPRGDASAESTVTITAPFLTLSFTPTGTEGGCPAEPDNEGCYFLRDGMEFRPTEKIEANKEYCGCAFAWHFHDGDARGRSTGEASPAFAQEKQTTYGPLPLTAENAAAIPCIEVLGAYTVRFRRY